jgi:hypothetical protein
MNNDQTILGAIDPEITERLVTRRAAIAQGMSVSSKVAAGLAMASVPVALAAMAKSAFAQLPTGVQDVLNFALALEIFENEFYKAVLGTSASATQNNAFAPVRTAVAALPQAAVILAALGQIQKHEASHVAFLTANGAVNALNLNADSFDFTGNRGNTPAGPFERATREPGFLLLVAQAAEDTGVRAYKGQAPNLMSDSVRLEAALRIHSVEARHASKIRRLRRMTGAPEVVRYSGTVSGNAAAAAGAGNITPAPPAGAVAALDLIYQNEQNTTHHPNINVATLSGLPTGISANAASEAFDEPLTKAQVIAIVQPFFKPTIPA